MQVEINVTRVDAFYKIVYFMFKIKVNSNVINAIKTIVNQECSDSIFLDCSFSDGYFFFPESYIKDQDDLLNTLIELGHIEITP